jgi:hypothetical protein
VVQGSTFRVEKNLPAPIKGIVSSTGVNPVDLMAHDGYAGFLLTLGAVSIGYNL